ncbi:MAG: phosphoglycerate mutase [Alphaproteobacteria bacterium]|nr:MAG: phosphoglycerate mutase [Alphaproteobacteria bacterium]
MLRLYVLRHAKSSWTEPGRPDFDRGLNDRGLADLPKIAAMMRARGYLPDRVLCSPSLRTRLTLHGIMAAFERPPVVDYVDSLYGDGVEAYFDCLRGTAGTQSLMIIGHNPMCEAFAAALAASGDGAPMAAIAMKFPTGALAVFDIDLPRWADIGPGRGYLADFVAPRDL